MVKTARPLFVALAAASALGMASAAPTVYEGFGYADAALLNGQAGGIGWSGGWGTGNPQAFITTPGLAYAGLATTPGAATATAKPAPPSGSDITFEGRRLASTLGTADSTVFLSLLLRPEQGAGFYGGLNLGDLFVGLSGNERFYGLELGPSKALSGVAARTGDTVLLVLRAQLGAGNDILDLFVDPDLGAGLPAMPDARLTDRDLGPVDFVFVNNAGAWTTDEVRIGATFADVVPGAPVSVPSTAWLLAGTLPLLLLRRRRRG